MEKARNASGVGRKKRVLLVSIIMAAYNEEKRVESAVKSLLRQTYQNKEFIVVNDGSEDRTLSVLRELSKKRSVKVIDAMHGGMAAAFNTGAEEAKGEILAFVASDSVYKPDYVENSIHLFEDPNVAGVLPANYGLELDSFVRRCWNYKMLIRMKSPDFEPTAAWILRRTVFRKVGGFDKYLLRASDRDLAIRIRRMGYRLAFEPRSVWLMSYPKTLMESVHEYFERGIDRIPFYLKNVNSIPLVKILAAVLFTLMLVLSIYKASILLVVLCCSLALIGIQAFRICFSVPEGVDIIPSYILGGAALSFLEGLLDTWGTILGFILHSLGMYDRFSRKGTLET